MRIHLIALAGFVGVLGLHGAASAEPAAVAAGEGHILAVEGDVMPVGRVRVSEFRMGIDGGKVTVELQGQEMEGTLSMKETKKRKVVAIGKGKYRYTITEDRKTERSEMMGNEQPVKETVNPLEDQPVIAEKGADGSWTAKLENGEATEEMKKELTKIQEELKSDTDLKVYGTARREVGDEWEVAGGDMMGIKGAEGLMKVKFEGIEEFQGERCAKLTGSLDLSGSPGGEVPEGMKMRMTGAFEVLRSLEHRVDLQNKLSGKMEFSADLEPQPGMKMAMKMTGPMESTGGSVISNAE